MLHLIWTKDNNAVSEEGKELKGIRARVIECYKSLYFDAVPDLSPKQQVSRIAKNMIESAFLLFHLPSASLLQLPNADCLLFDRRLTYEVTLAELTSLEELMRTMMTEDAVHPDVIAVLWKVYSQFQISFIVICKQLRFAPG
jgi:condensin complex subunit 1